MGGLRTVLPSGRPSEPRSVGSSAVSLNASTGTCSHTKSTKCNLGNLEDPEVISNSSYNTYNLVLASWFANKTVDASNGDGRTMNAGHKQTLQDDLVELGVSTTSQVTVQLY